MCEHLPKTVTQQRQDCDLNPGPSAPESSTLTTRLPSHPLTKYAFDIGRRDCTCTVRLRYVIVRPLSTVEYTSVASLFHCRQSSD